MSESFLKRNVATKNGYLDLMIFQSSLSQICKKHVDGDVFYVSCLDFILGLCFFYAWERSLITIN